VLLALAALRSERAPRFVLAAAALVCVVAVAVLGWKSPHSAKPAALAMASQLMPGDRVVFVDEMFYDLPFYAGLTQPAIVASDWASPEVTRRDNWRKELVDAGRFDAAAARELLWPIGRIAELACHAQPVWFVMQPGGVQRVAGVPGLVQVHADRDVVLMRSPGRRC
jgi:hypothetical protein